MSTHTHTHAHTHTHSLTHTRTHTRTHTHTHTHTHSHTHAHTHTRTHTHTHTPGAAINATWINGSLHFDWTHTFTSPSPLTFELSLGTLAGSGIIRKWVELGTDHTHYTVTDSRLSETGDYFLTVVAISLSGLHTTASNMVAGTPLTT